MIRAPSHGTSDTPRTRPRGESPYPLVGRARRERSTSRTSRRDYPRVGGDTDSSLALADSPYLRNLHHDRSRGGNRQITVCLTPFRSTAIPRISCRSLIAMAEVSVPPGRRERKCEPVAKFQRNAVVGQWAEC